MRRRFGADDAGAIAILYALTLLLLVGFVALVVDLGALRADKRAAQSTADFAATAAAMELVSEFGGSPRKACETAMQYFGDNNPLVEVTPAHVAAACEDEPPSPAFPTNDAPCYVTDDPADPSFVHEIERSVEIGDYRITLTWPVDIPDEQYTQGYDEDIDGHRCERFDVQIDRTRSFWFAGGVFGIGEGHTGAGAVARAEVGEVSEDVAALLILDRTGCSALRATGGSTIEVGAVEFEDEWITGKIYLDSDGTNTSGPPGQCSGNRYTIDPAQGKILAFGDDDVDDPAPGSIRLFAPDPPPCRTTEKACDPGDLLDAPDDAGSGFWPQPMRLPQRTSRTPADHVFNCKGDYPGLLTPRGQQWGVPGCTQGTEAHIDNLRATFGNAATDPNLNPDVGGTWNVVTDCNPSGTVTHVGNTWINCATGPQRYDIGQGTDVTVTGNLVVRGDIRLSNDGELSVTGEQASHPDECRDTFVGCYDVSSEEMTYVYMGNGNIVQTGDSLLDLHRAAVVFRQGRTDASGAFNWTAPTEGTPLWRLALWSESTGDTKLTGGGGTVMAGVFFTPNSSTEVAGGADIDTTDAQYFAWRLNVVGGGRLDLAPTPETAIPVKTFQGVRLIR